MTVALVILLNGSRLLNLLPCPICCRQLSDCALDIVKEFIPQATHEDDDVVQQKACRHPCLSAAPIVIIDIPNIMRRPSSRIMRSAYSRIVS